MAQREFPVRELIDRLRFLEAHEVELAAAEQDPAKREIHFKQAELHVACMALLERQIDDTLPGNNVRTLRPPSEHDFVRDLGLRSSLRT